jgi:hypothetical protein
MKLFSRLKTQLGSATRRDLNFESKWVVTVSDACVTCQRPAGEVDRVAWDDLKTVIVKTTDEGPLLPDVFWLLAGEKSSCLIPQGATGEKSLLEKLQALPNFDHEALARAMCSTDNREFVCWQKTQ